MLKDIFIALCVKYTDDILVARTLWAEIEKAYTGRKRYYHNLTHLQNMYKELEECRHLSTDWDTILFSLFYHDIVYNATNKDNEEKSAKIAVKQLSSIQFPPVKVSHCSNQIIATKSHKPSPDTDTNLLLDADMAILGYNWEKYEDYYKAVRKEYAIYPDFLYNPGRAKVLQHFLAMDDIYATEFFKDRYEIIARKNIESELALLI